MERDSYRVNEPSVISEVIDGETIVLNFESGHYYSFNPTASEIWQRLSAGEAVDATVACVARRFAVDPVTVRAQVAEFIRRLEDEGLIRSTEARLAAETDAVPPPPEARSEPAAFSPPSFEKFTDMEELLLLDPIHEVGETGWPRKL